MQSGRRRILQWTSAITILILVSIIYPMPLPLEPRNDVASGLANWETIATFFVLNYATHALTIKTFPGDSVWTTGWWTTLALLVPFAGVWRGCQSITRGMLSPTDDLQAAARAGALCALARTDLWRPRPDEHVTGCKL